MGIMSNKFSRRVALGSMVGGLASAAVVTRVLKSRYKTEVPPLGKYELEWGKYVKMFDVPIKEIEGPATFTLDFRPVINKEFRVISLRTSYRPKAFPGNFPQPPLNFSVVKGVVTAVPPVVANSPGLLVKTQDSFTTSRNFYKEHTERLGRACIIVFQNGDLEYFDANQHVPKKLSKAEVSRACIELIEGVTYNYPVGKPLAKGAKWSMPDMTQHGVERSCEISGFANVGGKRTMVVSSLRDLDSQACQQSFIARGEQQLQELNAKQGKDAAEAKAALTAMLQQIKKTTVTQTYQLTAHVDLETGIVVRQESRSTVRCSKGAGLDDETCITQMFDS